jgi:maltose O-acetyltransferase
MRVKRVTAGAIWSERCASFETRPFAMLRVAPQDEGNRICHKIGSVSCHRGVLIDRHGERSDDTAMTNERSEKEKMLAGELHNAGDAEILADQRATKAWLARYNAALASSPEERHALLRERLGAVGKGAVIRPPFHCDYGYNIRLGDGVFLNFGCVILDVVAVAIGAQTQIGPAVQIYAADHPRDAAQRRQGLEFGRPVAIGSNVWIGGGAIILPGVTIGDDAVIGAGSVVTRDVAAGVTVVGNPARPRASGAV